MIKKIGFGVVLYKTAKEDLDRLLRSISIACKYANVHGRVYLTDNSSYNDIDYDKASTGNIEVMQVDGGINVGFGAAHNNLIHQAGSDKCEYYIGSNPDGFFLPSSIKKALNWMVSAEAITLLEFRQMPQEHPKAYDPRTGKTNWCSGAAFIGKISELEEFGGFDENLFMYCEDVDLSWRYKLAGGVCRTMYDCLFFHDLSDERASESVRLEMLKSGRYLAWKWGCYEFQEIMEKELVNLKLADDPKLLPKLEGNRVTGNLNEVSHVVEFRRLFSFSSTRW